MKGVVLGILILTLSTSTSPALAAVFERDWKTPGDGLLTYDDVNQREWLDLSQTLLEQFPGSDLESQFQAATAELGQGGRFEGFAVALRSDVMTLAQSAGVDISSDDFTTNHEAVDQLIDLMAPTLVIADRARFSAGFLDEFVNVGNGIMARSISVFSVQQPRPFDNGDASLKFTTVGDLVGPSTVGVTLYRPIPEPSSLPLALIHLGALFVLAESRIKGVRSLFLVRRLV